MITAPSNGQTDGSPRFCVLGSGFETNNMGVGALAAGTISGIVANYPNAEITLLDYGKKGGTYQIPVDNRKVTVSLLNIRFSKKFYLKNNIFYLLSLALIAKFIPVKTIRTKLIDNNRWLDHVRNADVITSISGGDSFSDIYGLYRFIYVSLPQVLVLLLGKKLILLPQTYGPYNRTISREIARIILKKACAVYSRDFTGMKKVRDLLGKNGISDKLRFCHDVGFILDPAMPDHLDLTGIDEAEHLVGLNISGLLYMGGYSRNNMFGLKTNYAELTHEIIDYIIKIKKFPVLLVPHVFGSGINSESDQAVSEKIYHDLRNHYPGKLFLARGSYNQSEIKHIIGKCHLFIGARMHSCIAAVSQCIPTVGISYSNKFKGVFETIGMEKFVADPRIMNKEEIMTVIDAALFNKNELEKTLAGCIPQVKQNIYNMFSNLHSH
jgi:colanic acid/amylovoran biosynthesis protein